MKALRKALYKKMGLEAYLKLVSKWYIRFVNLGFFKKSHAEIHYLPQIINEGDVCIDIGANLGYYSIFMSQMAGKSGKVLSVEPIPLFQKIWKINVQKSGIDNLTLLPYALGEKEATIKMGTPTPDGVLHHGMTKVVDGSNQDFGEYFDAEMRIPDKLFCNEERIDFIKMDIEGYELIALQNMTECITKHQPKIQMELSKNRPEIFKLMEDFGYLPHILISKTLVPAGKTDLKNHKKDFYFIHRTQF